MDLREAAAANGRLADVALLAGPSVLIGLAIPVVLLAAVAVLRLGRGRTMKVLVLLFGLLVVVTATASIRGQASPPNAPSAAAPPPAGTPDLRWLPLAIGILLVLLLVAALASRRRAGPERNPPAATEPAMVGPPAGRTPAAVVGRRADPRTAIIRCYAAMEGVLATVPAVAPRAADSPSEVLDRALTARTLRSPGAWRLVELFDEARFSPHRMSEFERQEAEAALQLIFDELRRPRMADPSRIPDQLERP